MTDMPDSRRLAQAEEDGLVADPELTPDEDPEQQTETEDASEDEQKPKKTVKK